MHIRKLNSLRGLAAMIVFITHFSDITQWFDGALGGGSGAYGVMLFFMLSGFLMSHLYLQKAFNKDTIKHYFLARVARVVPLYLVVVFGSYIFTLLDHPLLYTIPDVNVLMGHILFLYGESVLWSIAPEMQFYFIFIIFWACAKNRVGYIYVGVIAVMILLFLTNFPRVSGEINGIPYNVFNTIRSLPFFFVGVICGLHYSTLAIPRYLKSHGFLLTLCLIPLLYPAFTPVSSDAKYRMWLSYEVLLVMASVFFAVVFLVPETNRLVANRLGDLLGKISYSLYLLHMPIILLVNKLSVSVELKLFISLVTSIIVAFVSYTYFEKPVANLIRKGKTKKAIG